MSWSLRWERKCASWVICAQTWVGHLDEKENIHIDVSSMIITICFIF